MHPSMRTHFTYDRSRDPQNEPLDVGQDDENQQERDDDGGNGDIHVPPMRHVVDGVNERGGSDGS